MTGIKTTLYRKDRFLAKNTYRAPINVSQNLEHLNLPFCFPFVFIYVTERRNGKQRKNE